MMGARIKFFLLIAVGICYEFGFSAIDPSFPQDYTSLVLFVIIVIWLGHSASPTAAESSHLTATQVLLTGLKNPRVHLDH